MHEISHSLHTKINEVYVNKTSQVGLRSSLADKHMKCFLKFEVCSNRKSNMILHFFENKFSIWSGILEENREIDELTFAGL